jgi:hypothetical protein
MTSDSTCYKREVILYTEKYLGFFLERRFSCKDEQRRRVPDFTVKLDACSRAAWRSRLESPDPTRIRCHCYNSIDRGFSRQAAPPVVKRPARPSALILRWSRRRLAIKEVAGIVHLTTPPESININLIGKELFKAPIFSKHRVGQVECTYTCVCSVSRGPQSRPQM